MSGSERPAPGKPAIMARGLRFCYKDSQSPAIDGLDFTVKPGEVVAIVGHTGAGKSTFVKCINGLIPHFQPGELSGLLRVLGLDPSEHSVADLSGRVGIVFQEFENQLFSTSVEQEVAFGPENLGIQPEQIRQRVSESLALVGLSGFEQREPAGLSGGEKQRLAIASVLAMRPSLLLLDEPTTDLDPEARASIYQIINSLRQMGRSVLVVDHQVEALLDFDSIAVMAKGSIVFAGRPEEVCAKSKQLAQAGVRPHQVALACQMLNIDPAPLAADEAFRAINQDFSVDLGRYDRVLRCESSLRVGAPIIEVENLSFSYVKGEFVLHDVSLTVAEGDFVAIVGRNGSGKTTFVKHLNGLLKPTLGSVRFRGRQVRELRLSETARHIGYVFQNPDSQIFCETVEDEVRFGPKNLGYSDEQIERFVEEALATVKLQQKRASDPFCLTKGERQRVAVASTLACNPEVIILDEPTTGLDYVQEQKLMGMLQELNALGKTIIFVTHSLWLVAQYARRVVAFCDGRIIYDGPVRKFFSEQNAELVARAGLAPPDIVKLSHRFGLTALSPAEFASFFVKSRGSARAS